MDPDAALAAYARAFEDLRPETLDGVLACVAEDVRFKDPFNDVRGRAALEKVLLHMFRTTEAPSFTVTHRARDDDIGFLRWRFTARVPVLGHWQVTGMSEVRLDARGRVVEHIDHWDAAEGFYERLAGLGWLLRRIKARLRAK